MSEKGGIAKVYGKPECYGCKLTKKVMEKEGIPYQYLDITQNEVANEEVKNLATGTTLPLVVAPNLDQWQGFSPDKIRGLKSDGT